MYWKIGKGTNQCLETSLCQSSTKISLRETFFLIQWSQWDQLLSKAQASSSQQWTQWCKIQGMKDSSISKTLTTWTHTLLKTWLIWLAEKTSINMKTYTRSKQRSSEQEELKSSTASSKWLSNWKWRTNLSCTRLRPSWTGSMTNRLFRPNLKPMDSWPGSFLYS